MQKNENAKKKMKTRKRKTKTQIPEDQLSSGEYCMQCNENYER